MNIHYESSDEPIKTADLGLAASLYCFTPFESYERDPKNAPKVFFSFKRTPDTERIVEAYWLGQLTVEPQDLLIRLKRLKNIIYNRDQASD